ncbi:hypothetical protein FOMPIDRAFT_1029037 [Fomitopsis schrenkii]|uniref:Endonuclease/exonuclease/phosphatase domain-containing protein n=1 Tax=Fomitopsis schrenkii TaxID=2126942 RepID=S8EDW9_FOMSC|nr:hypothetical protein FOMPIDRAFT_1029037 [Fomitopsis schrenkii]
MRERRLGIVALQETHLAPEDVETVHSMFGKRVRVFNSPDPDNAMGTRGVAFALNRELVDVSAVTVHVLVPGRAILIKTKWHNDTQITALNVYAPNDQPSNEAFWSTLSQAFDGASLPRPDVMLGDFNLTEEAIDRLPMKDSPSSTLEQLQGITRKLRLYDGWHLTEPSTCEYTFPQRSSATRSRLDRIYVTHALLNRSYDWTIASTTIPTDHRLVSVQVTAAGAPHIGKGCWTMPTTILADQEFIKQVIKLGEQAQIEAEALNTRQTRTEDKNAQLTLRMFKDSVKQLARDVLKTKTPKLKAAIAHGGRTVQPEC